MSGARHGAAPTRAASSVALGGLDVGVSLTIMQALAHHALSPALVACNLALCHCVYGRDRFIDLHSIDAQLPHIDDANDGRRDETAVILLGAPPSPPLAPLAPAAGLGAGLGAGVSGDHLPSARAASDDTAPPWWAWTTGVSLLAAIYLSTAFDAAGLHAHRSMLTLPVVNGLSLAYRDVKRWLGPWKPALVGVCWAYAIVFLPQDAVPSQLFVVYAALYAAASNIADVRDVAEDRASGIDTLPVRFGQRRAYAASGVLASLAIAAHAQVPDWSAGDAFVEVVSAALVLLCAVRSVDPARRRPRC